MSKKKSQTVLTNGQMKDLGGAVIQGIPNDLSSDDAKHWIGHKKELHRKITKLLRRDSEKKPQLTEDQLNIETLTLTVDYDKTIEQLVKEGKYNWSNDNITSKNFPTDRKGTEELEAVLVHFEKSMSTEQVLKELDKMELRAGETHELLALGIQEPDKQRKFPIVALGSVRQNPDCDRLVGCLDRWDGGRKLGLVYFVLDWLGFYRFLAFRK